MPNDLVAPRSLATANPAAARSRASSQDAGRRPPLSRISGSVSRTCLLIERTFPDEPRVTGLPADVIPGVPAGPPRGASAGRETPGQRAGHANQAQPVIAARPA